MGRGGGAPGCSPGTLPAAWQAHGRLAGCGGGNAGCAGSGPGDGPASCGRKYPEGCTGLRGGCGWPCPPWSPGWLNPAGTSPGVLGGCGRTPGPSLGRRVLLWALRPGVDSICSAVSSAGLPSSRKMRSYWREPSGGLRG